MKTRTVILGWIYLAYSLLMCWGLIGTIQHYGAYHLWIYRKLGFLAIQWPFWLGLLKKKPYAWCWWVLVVIFAISVLHGTWNMVTMHYPPHWVRWFLPGAMIALILYTVPPLWLLLTDKPSEWHTSEHAPDGHV